MITTDNIKDVLSQIGFEKVDIGDYYKIDYTGCSMAVDFDNAKYNPQNEMFRLFLSKRSFPQNEMLLTNLF